MTTTHDRRVDAMKDSFIRLIQSDWNITGELEKQTDSLEAKYMIDSEAERVAFS